MAETDRRRGTAALIFQVAYLTVGVRVERHSGDCCRDPPHPILSSILFLLAMFFGLVGLAVDRPKGRSLAALLIPVFLVVLTLSGERGK